MTNIIQIFTDTVISRSKENQAAFDCLYENKLYGNCFSILRQEIDSLIRVFFLLKYDDLDERNHYITQTANGEVWSFLNDKRKKQKITDRVMVDEVSGIIMFGWEKCIYNFSCGFIHLSRLHNYQITNPFPLLEKSDRDSIIEYMNKYHQANIDSNSSFDSFIPFLPDVMKKVADHVQYYTSEYLLTQKIWGRS